MIDNGLAMHPRPTEIVNVYDQNFNGLGATVELFARHYSDEKITRSKGKEVFTFQAMSSSAIYQHLKAENIIEFGGRWFRIKYVEDDESVKGLTKFTCYALWYELSEGLPSPLSVAASTLSQVAGQIVEPFGKWVKLVIPDSVVGKSVRGVTLKENSALYKLRYLAKQYSLELTFGYEESIENELRYVKTVVFLQPYTESKIEFPLVVEHNLKHVTRTEDSRNLVTAYKLTGKAENEGEEFTFASINGGNPFLVDTSWFTTRQMKPRIIPKTKQDDRFTVKQNMLDAARAYLDMYSKPLVGYEANAVLYEQIPDLHHTQLIIDDDYQITEWRKVTSRSLDYDDLTNSTIVFEDPRQDLMDLLNDDGDGALSYESHEQARTVVRFAHGPNGQNMNAESGPYIGVISTTKPISELTAQDFSWVKVKGEDGKPGADGRPGRDGVDGIAGKNGVGIIDTTISYFLSTSGSATPSSGWTEQVPTLVKGRYLWTKTTWRYSDGSQETGYNVSYIAQDGNKGNDGIAGKDGVGITRTVITYASSTSGTNPPSSGWQTQVPTVAAGRFLWTRTVWHYTDKTSETGYSVSKIGEKGEKGEKGDTGDKGSDGIAGKDGVGLRSTAIRYARSTNGTVAPSSGWTTTVPTVPAGEYLWTRTTWTYTDKTTESGYSVARIGKDGNTGKDGIPGKDGVGITSTTITYARSTNGTTAPSSGWTSTIPTVPSGQFLWTKTVWTYSDKTNETGYSVAKMGEKGDKGDRGNDGVAGKDGVGIKSTVVTYGMSRSESSRPTSWFAQPPSLVKGQYLWTRTVWTYTDNTSETGYQKSYIARDGNTGNDGLPGKDGVGIRSTVITYAKSTSGTSAPTSGWTSQVPSVPNGQYLWTKTTWNYTDGTSESGFNVSRMGANGATGPKGDPGRDGVAGAPGVGIRSTAITYGLSASESVQPTSWTSSVPTLVKGQYLWTKTVWTYTNNTSETGYSKNYIARDGNNGANGIAGKDGVGIRATVITYASSTSGTSAPLTGWQTQVPAVASGHFLWTRTVWTYTDGTRETGYNVSRMGDDGRGILTSFSFYKLTATADTPATASKEGYLNLSSTGPANVWEPYRVMTANANGWATIDVDRLYKKDIIPGKPFRWVSEISLDGVSAFGSNTDFQITMENWYRNSSGKDVYNPLGVKRYTANKFSATNATSVNNHLTIDNQFTVSQAVYDAIPDGSYLNLRIRLDRFTKASYHAKYSFVTYSTLPPAAQRGSGNYSTLRWQPLPLAPTQSNPFLWHYQVHLHTDGTLIYHEPTIIGLKGQDGVNGINGKDSSINITCGFTPGFYEKVTPVNKGVDSISYVGDGWARLAYTNSTTSAQRVEFWLPKPEGISEGQYYTFIHEFRNNQSNFNGDFYHVQENRSAFWGNGSGQEVGSANINQSLVRRFRKPYVQNNTLANTKELVRININVPAGKKLSVEMRVSCYVGKYEGPYIPYIGTSEAAWASKADADLTESQLNAIIQTQLTMQAELEAAATMANLSELERVTMEYIEKSARDKKQSEEALIEAGQRIIAQEEKLGGMAKLRTFLTTYIREAEEGMIFGSTNSDAQLKITNDRISMHTGNREVMSISQGVITINNGVFTTTLQVGRFRTESYAENPDINVCRYVG